MVTVELLIEQDTSPASLPPVLHENELPVSVSVMENVSIAVVVPSA